MFLTDLAVDKEEKASTNEAQEDNKPEATTAEDNTSDCPRPVEPPAPPRRFRTAFIFFSAARHKEIRDDPRYGEEEPVSSFIGVSMTRLFGLTLSFVLDGRFGETSCC